MTAAASTEEQVVCEWCGAEFQRPSHRGPTPRFCSGAHRQTAHRARQPRKVSEVERLRALVVEVGLSGVESTVPRRYVVVQLDTDTWDACVAEAQREGRR